jgi:predicted ATPase
MSDRSRVFLRGVTLAAPHADRGIPVRARSRRQIESIDFAPVTVFAGDNGTGKSTIVEALVLMTGFNVEGGGRNLRFTTYESHSDLHEHLIPKFRRQPAVGLVPSRRDLLRHGEPCLPRPGFRRKFPDLHSESHGESFLDLAFERFQQPGLLPARRAGVGVVDARPDDAGATDLGVGRSRSQFVIATHSPFLMAFPGASIYGFSIEGVEPIGFVDIPRGRLVETLSSSILPATTSGC